MSTDSQITKLSIPVNLKNPGHFFACCGILHFASQVFNVVTGHFDNSHFVLQVDHKENILLHIINKISTLKIESVNEDSDSPIMLSDDTKNDNMKIYLDFWNHFDNRPETKLFAGQECSKKIIERWHNELRNMQVENELDIFKISTKNLPSGFDTSTSYSALDVGFALNLHGLNQKMITYPVVEFFAHIGAQMFGYHKFKDRDSNWKYSYYSWNQPLSMPTAMAVAAGAVYLSGTQRFVFATKSSGQKKILIPAHKHQIDHE